MSTPSATPDIVGTVVAVSQPEILTPSLSPDGRWRAEVVVYGCVQVGEAETNAYEQLKLIQVDDGTERIADNQLQYCGGLGAYGLAGLLWSPNSRYFYYTNAREGVPDGCGYWERPLIRLDTTNWETEYLGGGPLSPDGTKIATWLGKELILSDIDRGEISRTTAAVPEATTGPIAWSPDSRALVYLQNVSDCPLGKSYVVRLDLPELRHSLLLESETPSFGGVVWDAPDWIGLFDDSGNEWKFDLATRELVATP